MHYVVALLLSVFVKLSLFRAMLLSMGSGLGLITCQLIEF